MLGALIGFIIKNPSPALSGAILSFAAGIMLAAAILGLILPSVENATETGVGIAVIGIFAGALTLDLIDRGTERLSQNGGSAESESLHRVMLFVFAIAIHNLPEGIAAGVGFGAENISGGLMIAGSIALHNLPEGMVVIAPLLAVGVSRKRALLIATATAAVEVSGVLVGYLAVSLSTAILPFVRPFAGGTMLYVILSEMVPETHKDKPKWAIYALLLGFSLMLAASTLLSG